MSEEMWDDYRALKHIRSKERFDAREIAKQQFEEARQTVIGAGLQLVKHTEAHYKLVHPKWCLEVYPGNRRIYRQNQSGAAPFLELPDEWTLLDVVREAIKFIL